MRIDEFLLARIAEDEAAAALLYAAISDEGPAPGYHRMVMRKQRKEWPSFWNSWAQCQGPAKLLAECEAKRRVIDAAWCDHEFIEMDRGYGLDRDEMAERNDYPSAIRILADVYRDHPDYDPAWAI